MHANFIFMHKNDVSMLGNEILTLNFSCMEFSFMKSLGNISIFTHGNIILCMKCHFPGWKFHFRAWVAGNFLTCPKPYSTQEYVRDSKQPVASNLDHLTYGKAFHVITGSN